MYLHLINRCSTIFVASEHKGHVSSIILLNLLRLVFTTKEVEVIWYRTTLCLSCRFDFQINHQTSWLLESSLHLIVNMYLDFTENKPDLLGIQINLFISDSLGFLRLLMRLIEISTNKPSMKFQFYRQLLLMSFSWK